MTASLPIGPRAKIARARKHYADLEHDVSAFESSDAHEVVREVGVHSSVWRYRLRQSAPVPPEISCIFGDLVHNLRACLDFLVCDLIQHNGAVVTSEHGFPVGGDTHQFQSAYGKIKKHLNKPARLVLKSYNPAVRSDNLAWTIHKLDIDDKHRLLLGTSLAHFEAKADGTMTITSVHLPRADPCKKDGDILYTSEDPIIGEDLTFGLTIAVHQPNVVECQRLIPFARRLIDFTDSVLHSCEELFV
jgi:hypothetical protein